MPSRSTAGSSRSRSSARSSGTDASRVPSGWISLAAEPKRNAAQRFWSYIPRSAGGHRLRRRHEGLHERCEGNGLRERRLVRHADLERPEARMGASVPPEPRYVSASSRSTRRRAKRSHSANDTKTGGAPLRGSRARISALVEASPVSRPANHGELTETASTTGSQGSTCSSATRQSSGALDADVDVQAAAVLHAGRGAGVLAKRAGRAPPRSPAPPARERMGAGGRHGEPGVGRALPGRPPAGRGARPPRPGRTHTCRSRARRAS